MLALTSDSSHNGMKTNMMKDAPTLHALTLLNVIHELVVEHRACVKRATISPATCDDAAHTLSISSRMGIWTGARRHGNATPFLCEHRETTVQFSTGN
jgi:hypothetical protein